MNIKPKYNDKGLVPAIVQDANTSRVLMMAWMNEEALKQSLKSGKVTFFSRSRNHLWVKGESSGNFLELESIQQDCDGDALLVKARPFGPVCHTGSDTCWSESNQDGTGFLSELESIIEDRIKEPAERSYVSKLFTKGINKIAQKVGEEAVEMIIEAKDDNDKLFLEESADLLFHYLVLLQAKGCQLTDVTRILFNRHNE